MTRRLLLMLLMDDHLLRNVGTLLARVIQRETRTPDSQNEPKCEAEMALVNSFVD